MEKTQKWVNLGLLVAAVLIFLFLNQLFSALWGFARLPVNEDWPVEPAQILAFVVAAGAALWARRYQRSNVFLNEVATELSKVSWPERKDTVSSAGVVVVLISIASLILFLIDSLWRFAVQGLLLG
ncbi:MAG TPA: preprotein translocase subunit SecE [bacterium]|nr:preprotein translocase subunit SecE [bacterium]